MAHNPIEKLAHAFSKLPGIGEKSAMRLAFHVFKGHTQYAEELASALLAVKRDAALCSRCFGVAPQDPCGVCGDDRRSKGIVCVVEEPKDVAAIEKTHVFHGQYHVLHGVLSPLDGISPEDLRISELVARVEVEAVQEVILATNSTVEGEATSHYIAELLKSKTVKVTRLASGMPLGSHLEYTDSQTLAVALTSRRELI